MYIADPEGNDYGFANRQRWGGFATQLVDAMYRNVLDRAPDADGKAYWLARLAGGDLSPLQLLLFFSESPENISRTKTLPPSL